MKHNNLLSLDTNIFGYGCINNTRIKKSEINEKSKNTKAYKAVVKIFEDNFFNPDYIIIDILNGNYNSRTKLNLIIEKLSNNIDLHNMPRGYIVIPTLSELGRSIEEVKKYLDLIISKKIAIMILDNEDYSSCDYSFNEFTKSTTEMKKILNNISSKDMVNKQGRGKTHILNDNFKKIYWYYENYYISENLALTNNLIGHFTKKVFYRLCSEYETSNEYANHELKEINKTNGLLLEKPKRYGMTKSMQEKFPELISLIDSGESIIESCHKLGIQPMTKNTYLRFLLKYETGKKGLIKTNKKYENHNVIDEILK